MVFICYHPHVFLLLYTTTVMAWSGHDKGGKEVMVGTIEE